mgnify:FL=1|jgi:hypothetical protein|nr:hypothetical protein [uncultured Acetatifactor sp.]
MENNAAQTNSTPEYPREIYEPVLATSMELDEFLRKEFTINYFDLDGDHEVHTCYGDIKMTIDALMDYTNLLDTICEQWKLEGYHRAVYQYHSDMLRKFSGKLQAALGYDYAATLEKCRKKQNRKRKDKDEDIGADGITLAARRGRHSDKKDAENEEATDKEDADNEEAANKEDADNEEAADKKNAYNEESSDSGIEGPSYQITLQILEGGTPMDKNELRTALEGHLDTLKRNLAAVSLEVLKTKYKKPFDELRHNIRTTATAYVKQVTLEGVRIHQDFQEEARAIIQDTIDQSGLLRQITEAAFQRQDMDEIDRLVLDLKLRINLALDPFYERHLRLYMKKTPPGIQPPPAEFYNEATGCIWRNGAWVPMEVGRDAVLLPVLNIPKAAA